MHIPAPLLADSTDPAGIVILLIVAIVLATIAFYWLRERLFPRQVGRILRRFFGGFTGVSAHEKTFPGYDLCSINRALDAFLKRSCTGVQQLGGMPQGSLADALEDTHFAKKSIPTVSYKRMPVDVGEEESVRNSSLWTATLRLDPPAQPLPDQPAPADARIVIAMSTFDHSRPSHRFAEGSPEDTSASTITISIACRDKDAATRLFAEIDRLRRELSIYKGKVITPEIDNGGIRSLGFSKIRLVAENEIILPDVTRRLIDGSVIAFYRNREKLRAAGVELKRGILLWSPPGTGKTTVALYLAGVLTDFTVCFVAGRQLLYPRELCQMARYLRPTMLVFEDIDLIAHDRDQNGLATILGELMNQIDGCHPDEEVLFLLNTNSLDRLEEAVRDRPGRVDQIVQIPLPDQSARRRLVRLFGASLDIAPDALERFAAESDGITPATIKEVVKRAAVSAVTRESHANPEQPDSKLKITAQDLLLALEQVRRSRVL